MYRSTPTITNTYIYIYIYIYIHTCLTRRYVHCLSTNNSADLAGFWTGLTANISVPKLHNLLILLVVGVLCQAIVQYGMVWYGMVWYSTVQYSIVQYSIVQYNIVYIVILLYLYQYHYCCYYYVYVIIIIISITFNVTIMSNHNQSYFLHSDRTQNARTRSSHTFSFRWSIDCYFQAPHPQTPPP